MAPRGGAARALLAAAALGAWCASGDTPPEGTVRRMLEKTPYPCKETYDQADITTWVDRHLSSAKAGNPQPHLLLMLGGSGAGKGTFLKRWKEQMGQPRGQDISEFVMHGLDEYLEYIPEYSKTIGDPENVYKDAADACYSGAAIPAAQMANAQIIAKGMSLVYEETGKNLDRIKKRVLPPYVEAKYRITVVLIDNFPETAIQRAAGRFQRTGRFAPEDYIRGTFGKCFSSFEAIRAMELVSEAVYCDNSGAAMKCWADGGRPGDALVPEGLLLQGPPQYMVPPPREDL